MKRILLVDNFDSFTYNLVHYFESLDCVVTVCFNNEIPHQVIGEFDAVVLSPGPGLPQESGALSAFVKNTIGKIPILGVCLGMQALALELGGELFNQKVVKHGVQEEITTKKGTLFTSSSTDFKVGLYHSWAVSHEGNYRITAESNNGIVMALENAQLRCYGVQFHPESIMTPRGLEILRNFLQEVGEPRMVNAV
ncbi:MAG: aminodeoxychorismate/anthranilate synthase component II [bacterium]|nr:aminodeoxychorismate/anthranilate synthase component II [bacterium]